MFGVCAEIADHISEDIRRIIDAPLRTHERLDVAVQIIRPGLPIFLDAIRIVRLIAFQEIVQLPTNGIVNARTVCLPDRRLVIRGGRYCCSMVAMTNSCRIMPNRPAINKRSQNDVADE